MTSLAVALYARVSSDQQTDAHTIASQLSAYPDNPDVVNWIHGTDQQAAPAGTGKQSNNWLSRVGCLVDIAPTRAPAAPEHPPVWRGQAAHARSAVCRRPLLRVAYRLSVGCLGRHGLVSAFHRPR